MKYRKEYEILDKSDSETIELESDSNFTNLIGDIAMDIIKTELKMDEDMKYVEDNGNDYTEESDHR